MGTAQRGEGPVGSPGMSPAARGACPCRRAPWRHDTRRAVGEPSTWGEWPVAVASRRQVQERWRGGGAAQLSPPEVTELGVEEGVEHAKERCGAR